VRLAGYYQKRAESHKISGKPHGYNQRQVEPFEEMLSSGNGYLVRIITDLPEREGDRMLADMDTT